MLLKNKPLNTTGFFVSLIGFLLLALHFPSLAESQPAKLESNVKKIVMMMNIVNKEYHEGVAEGKIITPQSTKRARYLSSRHLIVIKT